MASKSSVRKLSLNGVSITNSTTLSNALKDPDPRMYADDTHLTYSNGDINSIQYFPEQGRSQEKSLAYRKYINAKYD